MRRQGFTLIEFLLVCFMFGLLLLMLTSTLRLVFQVDTRLRQYELERSRFSRLERQLRFDAHAAFRYDVRQEDDASLLEFTVGERTVRYLFLSHSVVRTEVQDEKVLRRDSFHWQASSLGFRQAESTSRLCRLRLDAYDLDLAIGLYRLRTPASQEMSP